MMDFSDKRAPGRLVERQDIGGVLKVAADEPFAVDRLERNEGIIEERIRALGALDSPLRAPRRRLMRIALVAGVICILFSFGASAFLLYERYFGADEEGMEHEETGVPEKSRASGKKRGRGQIPATQVVESQQVSDDLMAPTGPVEETESPAHRNGRGKKSVLDRQLRLFKGAKELANKGAYRQAISKLDTLDRQYPDGPFGFESKELRAKCLFHRGRFAPAERLVETLVHGSRSNRKKAELTRFLGDIQQRRGRCDKAVKSYRRSLGLGLRAADAQAAQNGIATCTPKKGI